MGTSWSVTSQGETVTSTTDTITLYLVNGTWGFSVHTVQGYKAIPGSGRVTVAGATVNETIRFAAKATHHAVAGGPLGPLPRA